MDDTHAHYRRYVSLSNEQTYIPAIPGGPTSQRMAQAYDYYNMATNHPTPWVS